MQHTKNPVIWLRFIAWKMQFWWSHRDPIKYFFIRVRKDGSWNIPEKWSHEDYARHYNWYMKVKRVGWRLFFGHLRRFAGYAHKCEFTDPKHGLLYGGQGAGIDDAFDRFVDSL